MMAVATAESIRHRAVALAAGDDPAAAVAELVAMADGDRGLLEAARDDVARRLHGQAGDWTATAALTLLNKALVSVGWTDRYDWKGRWKMPRGLRMFIRP